MQSTKPSKASQQPIGSSLWAPFRIEPAFVARPWGSLDLHPWFDSAPAGERIGEVWLTGEMCRVATGPQLGRSLSELLAKSPGEMFGNAAESLLIKVLFAREKLSVQVHPDDTMAQKYGEPRGKTECWYALAAEAGAQLAVGLKPGVTLAQLRTGIAACTLEQSLQAVPVTQGETILVEAGTVHAVWPGSILLEVQQYCDLTYRLYDYGRPRELHVEKALEAVRLDAPAVKVEPKPSPGGVLLVECPYFRLERVAVSGILASRQLAGAQPPSLQYVFVAAGRARISGPAFASFELPTAGLAVVPAAAPEFTIEDLGELELIRILPR